jgi:hypothetical protein
LIFIASFARQRRIELAGNVKEMMAIGHTLGSALYFAAASAIGANG